MVRFSMVQRIKMTHPEERCRRCGLCCWYVQPDTGRLKPCKYLKRLRDGSWYCKVWTRRNSLLRMGQNLQIEPGVVCTSRVHRRENFPGCPYNQPGQPVPEWVTEVIQKSDSGSAMLVTGVLDGNDI